MFSAQCDRVKESKSGKFREREASFYRLLFQPVELDSVKANRRENTVSFAPMLTIQGISTCAAHGHESVLTPWIWSMAGSYLLI